MAELSKQMGHFGNMQGRVVEEMFYRQRRGPTAAAFCPGCACSFTQFQSVFGDREFDVVAHDSPWSDSDILLRHMDRVDRGQEPTDDRRCEHIDKRANSLFPERS